MTARTNYEWFIENNLDEYSGRWIAIYNNKVLESNANLETLLKSVKEKYPNVKPLITKMRNKLLRLHS